MRPRLGWRRSATAVGVYGAAIVGFLGTVVAARRLPLDEFGVFALALSVAGFFRLLLDLTADDAVVKFGFRYTTRGDWGRLRRLLRLAFAFKTAGAVLAAAAGVALAPFAEAIFDAEGLLVPMMLAALVPVAHAPEGIAASVLIVRGRYDVRAWFLFGTAGIRLVAIAIGTTWGVTGAVAAVVIGQGVASVAIGAAALLAMRRWPRPAPEPIADDRRPLLRFVVESSVGTGIASLKQQFVPVLLGLVSSPREVGLFRVAYSPYQGFAALTSPVRLILLSEQTHAWEQGAVGRVYRQLRRYMTGAVLLMLVAVPPLLLAMPFLIETLFGAKYAGAVDAARLIVVGGAVDVVFGWTKSFAVSVGRPNLRIVASLVELAVVVPLVLVLGARWGVTGAAGAVVAGLVVHGLTWVVLLARVQRGTPALETEPARG